MKPWAPLAAAGVLALLVIAGLRRPGPPQEPPPQYQIANGEVDLAPRSKLEAKLEIVGVGEAVGEGSGFRTVGQIIALSNTSGALTGDKIGWVELDPKLTAEAQLKLESGGAPGVAYGLTNLAVEFSGRVHPGQTVRIVRYGLKQGAVSAEIVKILPVPGDGLNVVFRFPRAQEWFPGTNCDVSFPVLTGRPVRIPTTAPVHEGTQDFVWKELGPRRYAPKSISVIDATPSDAVVLGLQPGDRIVGRGAILLKPLLSRALDVRSR